MCMIWLHFRHNYDKMFLMILSAKIHPLRLKQRLKRFTMALSLCPGNMWTPIETFVFVDCWRVLMNNPNAQQRGNAASSDKPLIHAAGTWPVGNAGIRTISWASQCPTVHWPWLWFEPYQSRPWPDLCHPPGHGTRRAANRPNELSEAFHFL